MGKSTINFITDLGRRLAESLKNQSVGDFLLKRVSLAILRGNAFNIFQSYRVRPDFQQYPTVHDAVKNRDVLNVEIMVKKGASINEFEGRNKFTPVHVACNVGALEDVSSVDEHCWTAVHKAAYHGRLGCLQLLVKRGARCDDVDDNGNTPYLAFPAHVAAYNGDLDSVRVLVENGVVNINERDDKGATLAHKAAGQGRIHVLQWLLEMGVDVTAINSVRETAYDIAQRFSHLGCVKLLGRCSDQLDVYSLCDSNIGGSVSAADIECTRISENDNAKYRAKLHMEELERLLDISKKNYIQLGGSLPEERLLDQEIHEKDHTIKELEAQLDYERLRKEKMEMQLDQYRGEICTLREGVEKVQLQRQSDIEKRTVKTRLKKKTAHNNGIVIRRNIAVPKKASHFTAI